MGPGFGLLLLAACAPPSANVAIIDLPEGVDWLAALAVDAQGTVLGGTGLSPAGESQDQLTSLAASSSEVTQIWVAGYREEALRRAAGGHLPDLAELLRSPVTAAGPEDPLLPEPDWLGTGAWRAEAQVVTASPPGPLKLRTSWLPPCPLLFPPGTTHYLSGCGVYCGGPPMQAGCELAVDLGQCWPSAPGRLTVSPRGEVSGAPASNTCNSVPGDPGVDFSFACDNCQIDAFNGPFSVPFQVAAVGVARPSNPTARLLPYIDDDLGYIIGLVARGAPEGACQAQSPRIIALTRGDPSGCGDTLVTVDPEAMTVRARTPLGDLCAGEVLPDPVGEGVLLALDNPPAWARLDCDLTVVSTVAIVLEPGARLREAVLVSGSPELPSHPIVALDGWTDHTVLLEFDPVSLQASRRTVLPEYEDVLDLAPAGPGQVASAHNHRGELFDSIVRLVRLADEPPTWLTARANSGNRSNAILAMNALSPNSRIVVSSMNDTPSASRPPVLRLGPPPVMNVELFDYTQPLAVPSGTYHWVAPPAAPGEERYLLVPTTDAELEKDPVTRLGLVDTERRRYLPGRLPIGYGPVGRILDDGTGTLWLPLCWSGDLLRVRPSAPQPVPE